MRHSALRRMSVIVCATFLFAACGEADEQPVSAGHAADGAEDERQGHVVEPDLEAFSLAVAQTPALSTIRRIQPTFEEVASNAQAVVEGSLTDVRLSEPGTLPLPDLEGVPGEPELGHSELIVAVTVSASSDEELVAVGEVVEVRVPFWRSAIPPGWEDRLADALAPIRDAAPIGSPVTVLYHPDLSRPSPALAELPSLDLIGGVILGSDPELVSLDYAVGDVLEWSGKRSLDEIRASVVG